MEVLRLSSSRKSRGLTVFAEYPFNIYVENKYPTCPLQTYVY